MLWLATSLETIVGNARCCLWAAEGDGRRGIVLAALTGAFQLATLALAAAVVRHRARGVAGAAIVLYGVITVLLLAEGGAADTRLWFNLAALVVAGLAIGAGRRPPVHRHTV